MEINLKIKHHIFHESLISCKWKNENQRDIDSMHKHDVLQWSNEAYYVYKTPSKKYCLRLNSS